MDPGERDRVFFFAKLRLPLSPAARPPVYTRGHGLSRASHDTQHLTEKLPRAARQWCLAGSKVLGRNSLGLYDKAKVTRTSTSLSGIFGAGFHGGFRLALCHPRTRREIHPTWGPRFPVLTAA